MASHTNIIVRFLAAYLDTYVLAEGFRGTTPGIMAKNEPASDAERDMLNRLAKCGPTLIVWKHSDKHSHTTRFATDLRS